jgi:hypothetical protein
VSIFCIDGGAWEGVVKTKSKECQIFVEAGDWEGVVKKKGKGCQFLYRRGCLGRCC